MGARGPAPKPSALKVYEGNPGKRAIPETEAKPTKILDAEPPYELKEYASKVWETLVPMLCRVGLMTEADILPFARYCDLQHEYCELRSYNNKLSMAQKLKPENEKIDRKMRTLLNELRRLEGEFGLTPAARTRIEVEVNPGTDPDGIGEFLFG